MLYLFYWDLVIVLVIAFVLFWILRESAIFKRLSIGVDSKFAFLYFLIIFDG